MYDYGLSTLEQYGIVPEATARTRGALLCRSEKGLLILKEFRGSEKKLLMQQELLLKLSSGGCQVDVYIPNQEGALVSKDKDHISYTLQKWYEGHECDTRSESDIIKSVRMLAKIHSHMHLPVLENYQERSLKEKYLRHNQELKKIRKFIRKKKTSSAFEKEYLANVQWFLERGETALKMLQESEYETLRLDSLRRGCICHGEYNQHNVLMVKNETAVTNFGNWNYGIQMADLYDFMRKMLEKSSWNQKLAVRMMKAYHEISPISRAEWEYLKIRFTYPEKYWKLANYYYSHNKAWISEKNTEKQRELISQKELWDEFAKKCFATYLL